MTREAARALVALGYLLGACENLNPAFLDPVNSVSLSGSDSQIVVAWTAPYVSATPVTGYTATATTTDDTATSGSACSVGSDVLSCTLTGLTNGAIYEVVVTAANEAGGVADSSPKLTNPRPALLDSAGSGSGSGSGGSGSGADLVLWFDAYNGVFTQPGDGSAVAEWLDQSDAGNSAVNAGPSSEPAFVGSGIDGLPMVAFDGSDDYLQARTFGRTSPAQGAYTILTVAAYLGGTAPTEPMPIDTTQACGGSAGSAAGFSLVLGSDMTLDGDDSAGSSTLRVDGSDGSRTIAPETWVITIQEVTAGSADGGLTLGAYVGGCGAFTKIGFGEVIGFDGELGSDDINVLEQYASHRWRVPL